MHTHKEIHKLQMVQLSHDSALQATLLHPSHLRPLHASAHLAPPKHSQPHPHIHSPTHTTPHYQNFSQISTHFMARKSFASSRYIAYILMILLLGTRARTHGKRYEKQTT